MKSGEHQLTTRREHRLENSQITTICWKPIKRLGVAGIDFDKRNFSSRLYRVTNNRCNSRLNRQTARYAITINTYKLALLLYHSEQNIVL